MKIIKFIYITSLVWFCHTFLAYAQYNPTVNHIVSDDGKVTYEHVDAGEQTYVFTIFGDGTFTTVKNPTHFFQPQATDYKTETYFARAYDPNLPPKVTTYVSTINSLVNPNTGLPLNPPINMTGNIDLMTSWATAQNYENFYIIAFTNTSSANPMSGCIEFYYNEADIDVDVNRIKEYNGWVYNKQVLSLTTGPYTHKIQWQFSSLNQNEVRYVYVPALTKTRLGKEHTLDVRMTIDCGSAGFSNPHKFLSRKYPHDPNFKIANKDCAKLAIGDQQELVYTIGFFNDGEYFAQDVFVQDELPSALDPDKITLLSSQYQPTWSERNGIVSFDFLNINLPGTNQVVPKVYTYDDASTYFSFKICTKSNLTESILNSASIVFDAQETYFTNTSKVVVEHDCTDYDICGESARSQSQAVADTQFIEETKDDAFVFRAFPNPVKNELHITMNSLESSAVKITLRDLSGRVIKFLNVQANNASNFNKTISLTTIKSGLYFLTLETKERKYTKKIIKN